MSTFFYVLSFLGFFCSFARADYFDIKGVELLLDRNSVGHLAGGDIDISRDQTNISLEDRNMQAWWRDDQIHLEEGETSVKLPFFKTQANTDLILQLSDLHISSVIGENFVASFNRIEARTASDFFRAETISVNCSQKSVGEAEGGQQQEGQTGDKMLSLCWDEEGTLSVDRFTAMGAGQNLLPLIFYDQGISFNSKSASFQNMRLSSKDNKFNLRFSFNGTRMQIKGSISYLPEENATKIVIKKAYYGILSIKSRIYRKLRKIESPYLEVKNRKDIFIYI